jgi:poly [ADP-ribose] polymerase
LLDSQGRLLPLQQVSIKAKILDNVSEVHIYQEYWNPRDEPIEAKFVFPLDSQSAVCGFEAFVAGRHIIGKVEEKQTAHKKYEEAISRGDGAFLMDQSEESPDVFTVSVGNLLPHTTAIIQITYVSELEVDNQSVLFRLPASLAPEAAMKAFELTQTTVQSISAGQDPSRLSVEIGISSPSIIAQINSSSHVIEIKRTSSVATVRLPQPVRLTTDFLLHIDIPKAHTPRLWLEQSPEGGYAAMLTLYPEITQSHIERKAQAPLVVLLLDRSYSLASSASSTTRLALAFLETIDRKECRLNVVAFGSGAVPAFSSPLEMDEDIPLPASVAEFVRGSEVDMGSTNLLHALQLIARLVPETETTINVVLLSDGQVLCPVVFA